MSRPGCRVGGVPLRALGALRSNPLRDHAATTTDSGPLVPLSPPHKHGRLSADGGHHCHHRVDPSMVVDGTSSAP
jgi:hypothetical protein